MYITNKENTCMLNIQYPELSICQKIYNRERANESYNTLLTVRRREYKKDY